MGIEAMNPRSRTIAGNCAGSRRSGQAIVEFIVGVIVVLVLVAGLLQVASLTRAHTDAMVNARREAAVSAMSDLTPLSSPEFILSLEEGADTRPYTRDDTTTTAVADPFLSNIVAPAGDIHWDTIDTVSGNPFTALHDNPAPINQFGLVRGHDDETITLLPGFRKLIYRASSITLEAEVWMTHTKGIY